MTTYIKNKIYNLKQFDFEKYCNCYNDPYRKITAECYDTVLEAIHAHETKPDRDHIYGSRLVIVNKFLPEFMHKLFIQNEFRKPVIIIDKSQMNKSYDD